MLQGLHQDLVLEVISVEGSLELPGVAVQWVAELEDDNAALGSVDCQAVRLQQGQLLYGPPFRGSRGRELLGDWVQEVTTGPGADSCAPLELPGSLRPHQSLEHCGYCLPGVIVGYCLCILKLGSHSSKVSNSLHHLHICSWGTWQRGPLVGGVGVCHRFLASHWLVG